MLFPSLFQPRRSNTRTSHEGRSRRDRFFAQQAKPRHNYVPRLEALEERTLLSSYKAATVADLIADIHAANNNGGINTITLTAPTSSPYFLTAVDNSTDGPTGLPVIAANDHLSIYSLGDTIERSTAGGTPAFRLFDVAGGASLTLKDLTLKNGLASGSGVAAEGGAIYTQGAVVLNGVAVLDNLAQGAANGANAFGGGLYSEAGAVTIQHSSFIGNQAVGGDGGAGGVAITLPQGTTVTLLGMGGGGGVWDDGGILHVANSAFTNNLALGGSNGDASSSTAQVVVAGAGLGGAIGSGSFFTSHIPSVAIATSTLSADQALGGGNVIAPTSPQVLLIVDGDSYGGALLATEGGVTIANSILVDNLAQDGTGSLSGAVGGGVCDEPEFGFAAQPSSLQMTGDTISGNVAQGAPLGDNAFGGGVDTYEVKVQVTSCTVTGNQAIGGSSALSTTFYGGSGFGGGIDSTLGSLVMSNSAVSSNLAQGGTGGIGGQGGFGDAGGIYVASASLQMTNVTLANNQALGGAGGFQSGRGSDNEAGGLYGSSVTGILNGVTFLDNFSQGGAGGDGAAGQNGGLSGSGLSGGARIDGNSTVQFLGCAFVGNQALAGLGGAGGAGATGGPSGDGEGGALDLESSTGLLKVSISNSSFMANLAKGGTGGQGGVGGAGGTAGWGFGGGVLFGTQGAGSYALHVANCLFSNDLAQGGNGGAGGSGANGGEAAGAEGGAIEFASPNFGVGSGASLLVFDSQFVSDETLGGNGGMGGAGGGNGGPAMFYGGGGAIFVSSNQSNGALKIVDCLFQNDVSQGGIGGAGGIGGNGGSGGTEEGGALLLFFDASSDSLNVLSCQFISNEALGGAGGAAGAGGVAGSNGQGYGGAIYIFFGSPSIGSVCISQDTLFLNNLAATAFNDIDGTYTICP